MINCKCMEGMGVDQFEMLYRNSSSDTEGNYIESVPEIGTPRFGFVMLVLLMAKYHDL